MSKRQRFVTSTVLTACLLIGATLISYELRYQMIGLLAVVAAVLTIWSIREGWQKIAKLTTLILPIMFTVGAGMFTFLLPEVITDLWIFSWNITIGSIVAWLVRGIFWIIFAIAFYSLLLTENIFSVSTIRTIALSRAAAAVGFILTLVTGFFLYNATWSFRLTYYWNGLIICLISFFLLLQGLWSAKLEDRLNKQVLIAATILSLIIGQAGIIFSFWPVSVAVASLIITTALYVLLGLYQQELLKRLFNQTIWEYLSVGVAVLVIITLTTRWSG